jgi:kynurenine formamidase
MINEVPIDKYVGHGVVLDFTNKPKRYSITKNDIATKLDKLGHKVGPGYMLFFYTGYTSKSRTKDWLEHPELSEEACRYIVKLGINAVGCSRPGSSTLSRAQDIAT